MEKWKSGDSTSLLSRNIKIEGEIRGDENLHIEGRFKGSIKLTGNVFIGTTGVVEADVEAGNIVIQGNVTGNVTARQQLEIQPTGKLMGDCTAQSIDIKEGAVFEGRSQMLKSAATAGGPGFSPAAGDTKGVKK